MPSSMNEFSQSSFHPSILVSSDSQPVIAAVLTEEDKNHIVRTLEAQSPYIGGVSTELAIQAGQNQVAAEVPKVYERFAKVIQQ
jgi:hypothetical protein